MLVDTDVLIWYMRGNKKAYNIIDKETGLLLSVVTYINPWFIVLNKRQTEISL